MPSASPLLTLSSPFLTCISQICPFFFNSISSLLLLCWSWTLRSAQGEVSPPSRSDLSFTTATPPFSLPFLFMPTYVSWHCLMLVSSYSILSFTLSPLSLPHTSLYLYLLFVQLLQCISFLALGASYCAA